MPTVERNLRSWNDGYDWVDQGEEWSSTWGGSEAQWFGSIFPRIHAFLPTDTILELAPGFGRWTHYLRKFCAHLTIVDLAETCINACRQRFSADAHITYHVNDGKSLAMIPDKSVDFVFSFDALVHAEADVLQAYLSQLASKLKPNGVGFIHHSNLGAYQQTFSASQRIPERLRTPLVNRGLLDQTHWRAFSMTAGTFEQYCEQAGLQCISQETVNWGTKRMIDCFSLFTPKDSTWARPNRAIANPHYMKEAELIRRLAPHYAVAHL